MEDDYAPPLPPAVTAVLERASLAYLATVEEGLPHLSLMSYTHADDEELGPVLVMTTRRDTKKYRALCATPSVAVLIHDFDGVRRAPAGAEPGAGAGTGSGSSGGSGGGTLAVTVYGEALLVDGPTAERLRSAHLARNGAYPQFIVGEGIAVVAVRPTLARMCDVRDAVTTWANPRGRPLRSSSVGSAGGMAVGGGAAGGAGAPGGDGGGGGGAPGSPGGDAPP